MADIYEMAGKYFDATARKMSRQGEIEFLAAFGRGIAAEKDAEILKLKEQNAVLAEAAKKVEAVVLALQQTDIMAWPKSRIESQDMNAQIRKRKWEAVQAALAALIQEKS